MSELEKKLILTALISGLNEEEKLAKESKMAAAHEANIGVLPSLDPDPATVQGMLTAQLGLVSKRDLMKDQLKQLTKLIKAGDKGINNVFVDQWRGQVQIDIAGDESLAVALGWGIKGQENGETPVGATIAKAVGRQNYPSIIRIDLNARLQHILHIVNSVSLKRALPKGILRIDIYAQIGGTAPMDYTSMGRAIGQATKGKFGIKYFITDTGKQVYYAAVYIDKKTKLPVAQSPIVSAMIN